MSKKKILIVISDKFMFRNYIKTNAFIFLKKNYECYFLVDNDVNLKFNLKKKFLSIIKYNDNDKKKYYYYYLSKIFNNLNKSSTYTLAKKIFLSYNKWIDHDHETYFKKVLIAPLRLFLFFGNYTKYLFLKLNIFKFLWDFYEHRILVNSSLENKIMEINPDLVILPTKASDVYYFDLKKISDKLNIKLLYLIDNWDNISAKSVLFKNKFYGVWGKQSFQQAKKIHDISLDKLFILGTPRFEDFFIKREKKLKRHYNFKYILFLENTYPREIVSLKYLDKIISKNKLFKNYKIIYRPHPWRKSRVLLNLKNYKNIIIDRQLRKSYEKKNFSSKFQPDLDYYPSLIKNAEFIISGPTTMVIESLIFRKKILLLTFKESNDIYSPHNLYELYEHFKGISKFKNIIINKSLKDLKKDIIEIYSKKPDNKKKIDNQRNYFIFRDNSGYRSRLLNLVNQIFSK